MSHIAAYLTHAGLLEEIAVRVDSRYGEATLPLLCRVGGTRWVPFVEREAWTPHKAELFARWMALVRASAYSDVFVKIYSPDPPPSLVQGLLEPTRIARLELEGMVRCRRNEFAANSRLLLALLEQIFDMKVSVEPLILGKLDHLINAEFGDPPTRPALPTTVYMFGSLLGEILCGALEGRWVQVEESGFDDGHAVSANGTLLNPLGKAEKRFTNGSSDSLWSFYQLVKEALGLDPS